MLDIDGSRASSSSPMEVEAGPHIPLRSATLARWTDTVEISTRLPGEFVFFSWPTPTVMFQQHSSDHNLPPRRFVRGSSSPSACLFKVFSPRLLSSMKYYYLLTFRREETVRIVPRGKSFSS